MATVEKKPRRLPKIKDEENVGAAARGKRAGKGDASRSNKKKEVPPAGRNGQLPPLKRGGRKGDMDTKSLVEMSQNARPEHNQRTSLTANTEAKMCNFYIDGDLQFPGVPVLIHPRKHLSLVTVAAELSQKMKRLSFGVRSIYTPRGHQRVSTLDDLTDGHNYICSSKKTVRGMDVNCVHPKRVWHINRPDSITKRTNKLLRDNDLKSGHHARVFRPNHDLSTAYTKMPSKNITVMKSGEPNVKHSFLLNRVTAQTYDQVLNDLSIHFGFAVRQVFTIDGRKGLKEILHGPDVLVVASKGPFVHLDADYSSQSRARTRMSTNMGGSHVNLQSRLQSRRNRLSNTTGKWKVVVKTNALPSAGTQAQVTITVYGNKTNSGPITLGHGDGGNFQPGQLDNFDVSVGNVGEIYKIRLAHDNSGDFPGWLCDEVQMRDIDTGEELIFGCSRWLARDEDDQEIIRELPVKRPGEAVLPLIKYQVDVYTGEMWGGGTEANVYINIYGARGDSGVRQLYADTKGVYFKKGQCDTFDVEAVSLGRIKRILVGHDGTGAGAGWFLDKVVIREPPFGKNQEYVFWCGRWLDEGEEDGKIVREQLVQDEYMDDILEKRNFEMEKWKYEKNVQVVFFCVTTGKALRLLRDYNVDGVGEEKDKHAIFNVIPKKAMKPMFASAVNPSHYLAIDNSRISGLGKGGPYCEFRVRVQADRTVLFESVKNPLQFLNINVDGAQGDVRGILDKEPSKRFYVYAKGCFRHRGTIMLCTSQHQCINLVKDDGSLSGRGKRAGPLAQFIVHKVSPGGIRMFESVADPGNFIRLKDGKIDCLGSRDNESHFLVLRHKDKGFVTLQSASQRGLFLGMTVDGKVHTTMDTGVRNIWIYPEVVEWGVRKKRNTEEVEEEMLGDFSQQQRMTPESLPTLSPKPASRQYAETNDSTEPAEEGDWGINVSTFNELTNADVALVAYGDRGNSGPIILGAPPGKQIFQDGNEDEFRANLLKVGKLYKIRLELVPKSSSRDPSWKVKDVRMQDLNTSEVLRFNFNRWLSRSEEDKEIMRELPVQRPGENVLPVHTYMVYVHTGKEIGAETDAEVYLTVHGERGDWGKRVLIQSNNNRKFRTGQVDVFHIEAVSLGNLQRCMVGHDATGAEEGWFLEKIVIKESDKATEEYVFICNRWLDTSLEDRKIERTLMVKEVSSPSKVRKPVGSLAKIEEEDVPPSSVSTQQRLQSASPTSDVGISDEHPFKTYRVETRDEPPEQEPEQEPAKTPVQSEEKKPPKTPEHGKYSVEVVTSAESEPCNGGGGVHITLYGDLAKSDDIKLYSTQPDKNVFEPGNIDQFTVDTEPLGELYKIRMSRDDGDKWSRWFLAEVRLTDHGTGEKMVFSYNRWLARDMEDGDLCRELPVVHLGKPSPILQQYQVQVHTGDHWGASTDANVYITVFGTQGDSGRRLLHKCINNRVKFRRGQVDTFEFDIVDLEEPTSVVLYHDGRGHGAGIFVEKVVIKEKEGSRLHMQYVFPCGRWLDDHEEDCLTERTLNMIDSIDTTKPAPARESKKSNGVWTATVKTSSLVKSRMTSKAFLTVYGTSGHSSKQQLTVVDGSEDLFTAGSESQFQIEAVDVGKVTKIRLEHDNSGSSPLWRVDYVKMQDNDTNEELVFYLDRWLAMDQDDGNFCREMPVVRKGMPSLPVLRYIVALTTGSYKDSGTDGGNISINLIGVDGDTGMRELNGPISKNRLPWQTGQTDIFVLEAVSVGKVKTIELHFTSAAQKERWYIQQVSISEGASALTQSVCYCHQWILANDSEVSKFPITELQSSADLVDRLDAIPKGLERPVKTKGRWTVYVQTGTQNDSGTSEKVNIVLCGLTGESGPVHVNAKDELNPGSFVKFEAKVSDIGLLFKVRFYFEDKHPGSSWFLSKMKLKDQDTGEELHFEHNDWIESTNENPEGATELPVARPDLQPLKEQIYIVSVKTGDLPRAETDANVYCQLIGQWGGTGQRSLAVSSNKELYRGGQIDEFTLTCIDLGEIQKVVIGHDQVGRGQGWFCQSVSVKVAEETETVFPCNRWLDTGCDDRKLCVTLLPLTRIPLSYYLPTKYKQSTDGKWNFHITTAGLDKLAMVNPGQGSGDISVVVYGKNSVKGPIELMASDQGSKEFMLLPGKTEHYYNFDLEDIGEIEKIRVSSGYEGDREAVWTIQQVELEEQTSHDRLLFDFRGWVGEVGGDIRKEMSLMLPDKSNRPIIKYYIEVHTSEEEMNAATNSNVFVTLYGSNSDSGRRHLFKSKNATKRFQQGQVADTDIKSEIDKFELEAIDLGDLEKLVVAKGPGKPWLLEKIVVKKGEFAPDEQVFLFNGWIGDKNLQNEEIEKILKVTATIPSQVAIPETEAPDLELSDGCWSIESMTGGRRGPDGPLDAVIVFCGQNGESKPIPLQSNRENPFQIGQTDNFKVNYKEKIGELRKVRLGFINQADTKAWFVRKITFEDDDSHDVFWADLNDWIAIDNKLDGWKEIPVPWPAILLPPVVKYIVSVHVGELGAEGPNGEVYICMYGEQGGTGKRILKHSTSNTEMIKANQVDVFEVEAVHLGDLVKVVVGHSSAQKGCGWYLERVIVQESPETKEILFECNRWLDAGEADGEIERTLYPIQMYQDPDNQNNNAGQVIVPLLSPKMTTPEYEPTPVESPDVDIQEVETQEVKKEPTPTPQGTRWTVTTTTGGGAGEGTGSGVIIILYGDKGHSSPCMVGEKEDFRFNAGNTDMFNIEVSEDIGELFKVRLGFLNDDPDWFDKIDSAPTWFLEKLSLRNEDDQKVYEFEAGQWVKVTSYQDYWRELPVKRQQDQLEVYQYKVSVFTGDQSKAGTDANVYLQIFGECGDSGYRKLMTSKTNTNKFESGNKDVFELGAVDLGKLSQIKIRHDGSGPGSGWLLDRIIVQETEETTIRYVFRYERWLDEGDGENGVEQTLMLSEMLVSDEDDNEKEDLPGYPWKIETLTAGDIHGGTGCPVKLVFCERNGHEQSVIIGEKEDFRFDKGAANTFNVRVLEEIKDLYKMRIGFHGDDDEAEWYEDFNQAPSWSLEQLRVTDESNEKEFDIKMPIWLRMDGYQDHWREQPIIRKDGPLPDVYQYQVEVYTGDVSKAGTDANIFLNITGQNGNSGMRKLITSQTHSNKFEQGNCDLFELNAVDLGDLKLVKVCHDGAGIGSGWYLDKIVIKETQQSQSKYVFKCEKWLEVEEGEKRVTEELQLWDVVEAAEKKEPLPGNPWTVWSVTGSDVGEGVDNPVELILYGNLGHSSPVIIGAADGFTFDRGQIDAFEVKVVEEIGELYKVRVGFHGSRNEVPWYLNYHLVPSWFIESLKLKDETTGMEYEMEAGVSVQVEKYTDFWRELPVVNTNNKLNVYNYQVEVYTGEKFKAGTDANVSLQIYGERGDTGLRRLMESKTNSDKFEGGEKDVFEIPAVDLGKLTQVKVSHDGSGAGSGWLLDKVIVKVTEDATSQYLFECGKWLDEGKGDSDVEITLPLTDVIEVTPAPQQVVQDDEQTVEDDNQYKDGDWKVFVTTSSEADSGTDSNVTLTVYGDADNTGPLPLGQTDIGYFYSGKTDEFDFVNGHWSDGIWHVIHRLVYIHPYHVSHKVFLDPEILGQLRKIRLEHDNSGRPWQVEKVVMLNMVDKTEIEFPINKWLTLETKGFDIAVEAPTKGHDWPVRNYVVQTLTGDGFGSGTDATVYINLIGTLGDSGKRYLVHNMEGTNDKFESGQKDTFVVQAVDMGRLMQVQIGHTGKGPGSGWFLKTVTVKESYEAEDKYVFTCDQWLHDDKEDGLTERLLMLDFVAKDSEPFIQPVMKTEGDDAEAEQRYGENTEDSGDQGASQVLGNMNTARTNDDDRTHNDTEAIKDDNDTEANGNNENVDKPAETEETTGEDKTSPLPKSEQKSQSPAQDEAKPSVGDPETPKEDKTEAKPNEEKDPGQLEREGSETYRVNKDKDE